VNASSPSVLVVDDESDIRELLVGYLMAHGCRTAACGDGASARALLRGEQFDVVLLDLNLGGEDGLDLARDLRGWWNGGMIIVTGRGDVIDRVVGLELGADDYVTKPFELRELLARIRSLARRVHSEPATGTGASGVLRFGDFALDPSTRTVRRESGEEVLLTSGEYALLYALARCVGTVVSRDELLTATHGREAGPFDRTVDVMIGRLRRKLGDSPRQPRLIKTVRGGGYLLASGRFPASSH